MIEFYNISGDFDFMLKIISSSMDDFHDFFVNRLSEIDGIGQTKSIFVMNTIKESQQIL
ncbi:Lrp/AsnC ligand binding domain-containing protein [Sphingobacterium griseoflavum]|uniref:Lrp/AsnC ligand binding domain-containing protein n=1 Tax=Sphingobacterium griseoflavum TaxID=1474952 RepID=UPI001E6128D9|nr:Lrp/AsnC ligand binding domain-containing protein [Sphingobacterium griseoflavum]